VIVTCWTMVLDLELARALAKATDWESKVKRGLFGPTETMILMSELPRARILPIVRSPDGLKMKNPDAPAVTREAEEDCSK